MSAKLDELREAFEAWAADHGAIWFDDERRLAKAIAPVVGIDLVWSSEIVFVSSPSVKDGDE